ncbi:Uma2 family endonuclease [Streptomyces sp. AC558_RSS880]|uniref:Uma2 family endonuclease n=1 Tax=Streptomyces sp. AC558_RSS880 TaxID=2823687 RepID=UPI0027E4C810|nr:Uma2 family endonuclease [Streptomyces sp. AC558_RSS880]
MADELDSASDSDPDEVLWQAWKTMELPEGHRAEIIEGAIEMSLTGCRRHAVLVNRLRRAVDTHVAHSGSAAHSGVNVIHRRKAWLPDLVVAPLDLDEIPDEEGFGVDAAGVELVIEITSPGHRDLQRDRIRKRREYARAGIPVYVVVDDFDDDGAVLVLTSPDRKKGKYADEHRAPYGTDAVVPEGPAKGFAIGKEIVAS